MGGNVYKNRFLLEFWQLVRSKWCAETEKGSKGHGTQPGQTCLHNSICQYQHPYPTTAGSHHYGSSPDGDKKQTHETKTKE